MALKPIVLIAPTTDEISTTVFNEVVGADIPATLIALGLDGVEKVEVFISPDNGETEEAVVQETVIVTLTASNNVVTINSPMTVGVQKSATTVAVGVFLSKQGFA